MFSFSGSKRLRGDIQVASLPKFKFTATSFWWVWLSQNCSESTCTSMCIMNFWCYGLSWRNLAKLKDKLPHLNTRVQKGAGKAEKLDTAIIITSASSKNVEKTSSISSMYPKSDGSEEDLKNQGEFWVYILGDFRPKVQLQLRCQKPTRHHVEPQTVEDRDFPGTGIITKIDLHNFKSCPLLSYVPFKQSCILATNVSIFSWFPYGISLNCWKHPLIPFKASTYAWQAELMSDLGRPRPTLHSLGDPPQENPTKKLTTNSWTSSLRKHVSIHVLDSSWWLFHSTPFESYAIVKLDRLSNVPGEHVKNIWRPPSCWWFRNPANQPVDVVDIPESIKFYYIHL